jgi:phosphoribosyl-AMP cyclohydrolase
MQQQALYKTINFSQYHTSARSRQYLWIAGKKIKLPDNDPGGEHE